MGYNIKISDYIKNLRSFVSNPMQVYQKYVLEITYAVLWQMAYHQIWDTGQGRSLIIKKFVDKFNESGIDMRYDDLIKSWEPYWGNIERHWGNTDGTMLTTEITNKSFKINQNISDEAIFAQEYATGTPSGRYEGFNYPSNIPARDNTGFRTRHITYVVDAINAGDYGKIQKLNYDKLVSDMTKSVETFLFTGK